MDLAATAPSALTIELPEEEEALCERYGRSKFRLALTELLLLPALLAGFTFSGSAAALLAHCRPPGAPDWVRNLVFLFLVGLVVRLILLPLHYLSEQWLDRQYGMTHQSPVSWFWEWLCRSGVFGLATLILLFFVVETVSWKPWLIGPWSLAFVVCRSLFYDFVYYPLLSCFYPVRFLHYETFALPGHGKRTLPVYEIQVSHKTRRANAAIRLRGKRTAIYVTDTLVREFTDGEEQVVMAHEFGHLYDQLHLEERTRAGVAQAHRKLVLGSAQLLAGIVSLCVLHVSAPLLHLSGVQDLAGLPLLAAMTLILAHLFSPLLCAEARRDERDADEYALNITGDAESYVSVMRKLRRMNLEERGYNPIGRFLFDTHPSYQERLHLAQQYRRRHHPKNAGSGSGCFHRPAGRHPAGSASPPSHHHSHRPAHHHPHQAHHPGHHPHPYSHHTSHPRGR